MWEAADLQWWWRTPRRSDAVDQHFWIDDEGPVAGAVLTDWGSAWGCDLIVVPGVTTVPLSVLWRRAVETIEALAIESVDVLVDNDDAELVELLTSAGFHAVRLRIDAKMIRFQSAEHMVRALVGGAPTMLGALTEQGEGVLDAIVAEVSAATRAYVDDEGWAIPAVSHIVTASA